MVNFRSRPLSLEENRECCTSQPFFLEQFFLAIRGGRVSLRIRPKGTHTMDRQSWYDKKYEDEVRSEVAWCSISVEGIAPKIAPGGAGRSLEGGLMVGASKSYLM